MSDAQREVGSNNAGFIRRGRQWVNHLFGSPAHPKALQREVWNNATDRVSPTGDAEPTQRLLPRLLSPTNGSRCYPMADCECGGNCEVYGIVAGKCRARAFNAESRSSHADNRREIQHETTLEQQFGLVFERRETQPSDSGSCDHRQQGGELESEGNPFTIAFPANLPALDIETALENWDGWPVFGFMGSAGREALAEHIAAYLDQAGWCLSDLSQDLITCFVFAHISERDRFIDLIAGDIANRSMKTGV